MAQILFFLNDFIIQSNLLIIKFLCKKIVGDSLFVLLFKVALSQLRFYYLDGEIGRSFIVSPVSPQVILFLHSIKLN